MPINYSLYLVTDSTAPILGAKTLCSVVEAAVQGGVTVVQYRDKTSETAALIRTGKQLHAITKKYNVPLLINDRVDVALAIGAEGVHLGQDDMDVQSARGILGPDAVIGVTANSVAEAVEATKGGADYLGIGTVYATPTKENTKSIIGTAGVRDILHRLSTMEQNIPTVAIGGLNLSNVQRVMFQSKSPKKGLDGVAVVSAIMAAEDPRSAAAALQTQIDTLPETMSPKAKENRSLTIIDQIPNIVRKLGETSPLCHNMTNLVVQNFAANVALAIGASPIMANYGEEAKDLAALGGALVINMGTVTPDGLLNYTSAMRAYNGIGGPTLLDPVGAGATEIRRQAVKTLMSNGYFDVIKGNESEIRTVLFGETLGQQKGVDSGASGATDGEMIDLVEELANRERNIVLVTGATDYLSDGVRTFRIRNGHEYLGRITGSGCTLGTTIAAFLAVHWEDELLAALAGILMFEIAAEQAAAREDVKGPGTFVPAFLDQLHIIAANAKRDDHKWLRAAKVECLVEHRSDMGKKEWIQWEPCMQK